MKYHWTCCLILIPIMVFMGFISHAADQPKTSKELHGKTVTLLKYGTKSYYVGHQSLHASIVKRAQVKPENIQFKIVPGLADENHLSFESVDLPGHFLRHQGWRVKLHPGSAAGPFKADSTFIAIPGLNGKDTLSFRSVNFPNHVIAETEKKELWMVENPRKSKASFVLHTIEKTKPTR